MISRKSPVHIVFLILTLVLIVVQPGRVIAQSDNPSPPEQTVKLIFIHHSSGENWLTDGNGDLGLTLGESNYFVSDTNYGWGPDSIGDRTDIVNWREWFRGPESPRYLEALYHENGQNASYTRNLPDPGGENEIVMFKSCFPNSLIEGNPNDPPQDQGDALTVSNARFIYNDLLNYFITRPDKLFIVITAPPVQDATYAANARAFNTWLLNDWLRENNYPYNNVAVFDFYNVLTGENNHHRFVNGAIEYIADRGGNTAAYPTEDDHPSSAGNRKATEEFVPLLNVYYHRWKASGAGQVATQSIPPTEAPIVGEETAEIEATESVEAPVEAPPPTEPVILSSVPENVVDDFESILSPEAGWQPNSDESTPTKMTCGRDESMYQSGKASLRVDYAVAAGSWGTCARFFDVPQDWRSAAGLSFFLRSAEAGKVFALALYAPDTADQNATYLNYIETSPESVSNWVRVDLPWSQITRAEWEVAGQAPFDPSQAIGLSFAFDGLENATNTGTIWVDDIQLVTPQAFLAEPTSTAMETTESPTIQPTIKATPRPTGKAVLSEPAETPEKKSGGGLCPAPMAMIGITTILGAIKISKNRGR